MNNRFDPGEREIIRKGKNQYGTNSLLLFFAVLFLSIPVYFCSQEISADSQLLEDLDLHIQEATEAEEFSGVVLLAKDGEVFFKKAYGLASKRFSVPNQVDTKFNLGSMNKMFTTIAIAQLVEKGSLSYDDPIGKYLGEDWLSAETGNKVKISHLLTHTSGFGSHFTGKFWQSAKDLFKSVDDYKQLVAHQKLQFEPGTKWSYSNTGFIFLGAIIEKVTGEDYFDYVMGNIYEVAGMGNTDCYDMERPVPNLAIGYGMWKGEDGKEHWENNLFKHDVKGCPGGGGFSTAEDLLNFDIALRTNSLVSKDTWELLMTEKPNTGEGDLKWGYGFVIQKNAMLGRIVGHGGGFFGINSNLDMYLDSGYTVVVMSNYTEGVRAVSDKIVDVLIGMGSKGK